MPAAVAVPAVMGAVGTAASLYGAGQARSAQNSAIDAQKAMADRLFYMGMPAYGKQAKKDLWSMLSPMLADYTAGKTPEIISPDLQNQQYAQLLRTFQQPYQTGRGQLEQGMTLRGLDYGTILPEALGRYDQRAADTLASAGTDIATRAAQLNYGAKMDQQNALLTTLQNLFRQGAQVQQSREQAALGLQSDALSAGAASNSNYWSSLASGLGSLTGTLGGYFQNYFGSGTPSNQALASQLFDPSSLLIQQGLSIPLTR